MPVTLLANVDWSFISRRHSPEFSFLLLILGSVCKVQDQSHWHNESGKAATNGSSFGVVRAETIS
jgi:hypothetical protein